MTAPATLDLTVYQGATLRVPVRWTAGGLPVDLTGFRIRCHARRKISDPVALLTWTSENGGFEIVDAVNGRFDLVLTATQSAAVDFKTAVYDIEMVSAGGEVTRLIQGTMSMSLEVTRNA